MDKKDKANDVSTKITFEEMPCALVELCEKVEKLTSLVQAKFSSAQIEEKKDNWMDLNELIEYLPDKPSKATVYTWVCNRSIPFHKKTKKLSFLKSEIDEWMMKGSHSTAEDMKDIALETFGYRKGGLR